MSDNDTAIEPYVLLERPLPAWRELPAGLSDGRRPEIVLVDRDATAQSALAQRLFDAGFDVYRTAEAGAARELVEGRSSILMVVVRIDQPELGAARAIRELARVRPGLWIGMLGAAGAEAEAAAGYRAGADDLLLLSENEASTAGRLARSATGALRKRDRAARFRRSGGRAWRVAGVAATAVLALATGVLLALATTGWHEALDQWDLRLDRLERLLDGASLRASGARGPEFRAAVEAMEMERFRLREEAAFRRDQLEETRLGNLFRNFAPRYARP